MSIAELVWLVFVVGFRGWFVCAAGLWFSGVSSRPVARRRTSWAALPPLAAVGRQRGLWRTTELRHPASEAVKPFAKP
jgi:hypothetical protein